MSLGRGWVTLLGDRRTEVLEARAGGGFCPRGLRDIHYQNPLPQRCFRATRSPKAAEEPLFAPKSCSITSLQGHSADHSNGAAP